MAENIRDITVTVEVDTNKRTVVRTYSGNSVEEALNAAQADWKDGL